MGIEFSLHSTPESLRLFEGPREKDSQKIRDFLGQSHHGCFDRVLKPFKLYTHAPCDVCLSCRGYPEQLIDKF